MRPPRPSKGDEFDQLMGLEPASINRQTPRSKPVAIPTPLTLFVARLANKLEFFPLAYVTMKTIDVCMSKFLVLRYILL